MRDSAGFHLPALELNRADHIVNSSFTQEVCGGDGRVLFNG